MITAQPMDCFAERIPLETSNWLVAVGLNSCAAINRCDLLCLTKKFPGAIGFD
jgi:hypothetical protein